ncbi:MAG: Non-specific serine/threonine protein kinase [Bacteroidetes bacterium]|jgi:tetratricopeptide (TPR) repeat protein|nr:Non-specific serine/threonine protein kinase [Bacteroidota bacterium]
MVKYYNFKILKALLLINIGFLPLISYCQKETYNKLTEDGLMLMEKQEIKEAIFKFQEALKIDSLRVEANYGLGVSYLAYCGKQAIFCDYSLYYLNKAIRIDSTYRSCYYNRAHCKAFLSDYVGSIKDFDVAILRDSTDANIYFSRAMAKLKINDKTNACEDLYKSLKLGSETALKIYTLTCE